MTPAEADRFVSTAAAYVHIPFCSAVCPYCDFAVVAGQDDLADSYADAVVAEVAMAEPWRALEAVYFGGGTPSHLRSTFLAQILDALASRHGIVSDAEISLEANPEDFDATRAEELRSAGFNRVSFGAQSLDSRVLRALGRRHGRDQVEASVRDAHEAGFENISLDLILGTPGETDGSWEVTLEGALALDPDHLSCYALTVERGTPLGRAVRGGAPAPDADVQAGRYEVAEAKIHFGRYEVSNWAKPGHECRYSLTVWAQGEYEAYGNAAHGHRGGVRYRNHRRLEAYLDCVERGQSPRAGEERLTGWASEIDRVFVGLRRTVGVAHGPATNSLLASEPGRILSDAGVIESDEDRLRVVRPLMTDSVLRAVMALEAPIVSGESHARRSQI